jgi:hypothetical protein
MAYRISAYIPLIKRRSGRGTPLDAAEPNAEPDPQREVGVAREGPRPDAGREPDRPPGVATGIITRSQAGAR